MKKLGILSILILVVLAGLMAEESDRLTLLPWPESVENGSGQFRLNAAFSMVLVGNEGPRLRQYCQRVLARLAGRTGLFWERPEVLIGSAEPTASMTIRCKREEKMALRMDESYRLTVYASGIRLEAATDIGALRGLETFLQLLAADESGYYLPAVTIVDRPRFPWRGLLLDSCRHFLPLGVITRNLDGMAAVKMNVLHWHLTENQGFRVESRVFPRLQQLGSDGFFYTQDQVQFVVEYARMRGIRVVPEFDLPGHSTSWLVGYPELGSGPGPYTLERRYGVMDATLDPTLKRTYRFLDRFFSEMSQLFPDDYIHIGGDEVNGNEWNANPAISKYKREKGFASNLELQAHFNARLQAILKKRGKNMIGWDEIFAPGLDRQAVIQSWRGRESLVQAAGQGYQVLLSNGYYIDLLQPTLYHYGNDPLPDDLPLKPEQRSNILGGEATMWSELVTAETVDSRIWPRTAAIAERLWSPGSVRDPEALIPRLEAVSLQLEEVGLCHQKNREMMLRRLAGGGDPHPLRQLLGWLEPVKVYGRQYLGKDYTFFSPLTRMVDAAIVDPAPALKLEQAVDRFLQSRDQAAFNALAEQFLSWEAIHERLLPLLHTSPILAEVEPWADRLGELGRIGREAAAFIFSHQKAPDEWLASSQKSLEGAAAPIAEMELRPLPKMRQLVGSVVPVSRKEKEE